MKNDVKKKMTSSAARHDAPKSLHRGGETDFGREPTQIRAAPAKPTPFDRADPAWHDF
jgi:hypothetical protein